MINFNLENNILTCQFDSRMNTEACIIIEKSFNEQIQELKYSQKLDDITDLIFDLEKVDYIASAFLRLCIKTSKEFQDKNFIIKNVSPNIKKVFKISGFDKLMTIE